MQNITHIHATGQTLPQTKPWDILLQSTVMQEEPIFHFLPNFVASKVLSNDDVIMLLKFPINFARNQLKERRVILKF